MRSLRSALLIGSSLSLLLISVHLLRSTQLEIVYYSRAEAITNTTTNGTISHPISTLSTLKTVVGTVPTRGRTQNWFRKCEGVKRSLYDINTSVLSDQSWQELDEGIYLHSAFVDGRLEGRMFVRSAECSNEVEALVDKEELRVVDVRLGEEASDGAALRHEGFPVDLKGVLEILAAVEESAETAAEMTQDSEPEPEPETTAAPRPPRG